MSNTPSRRRRLVAPIAVGVTMLTGLTFLASGAWFTSSTTVGGNSFTAGTVVLATTPTTTAFNVSNMAPGDVVYREITVSNTGSLAYRYSLSQSVGTDPNNLASQLDREVKVGATTCDATGFAAATTTASATAKMNVSTVFGNPDAAQTGTAGTTGADRVLAAGASEKLCIRVFLPTATGDAYQGRSITDSVFTFDAVQTKNN